MDNRLVHVVNAVLVVVLLGGSVGFYRTLPERLPHHFGLYGAADAYWETSLLRWFLLPILSIFTTATLYGPAWIVTHVSPSWINVPDQEAYESLSDTDQQRVLVLVQQGLYWMATFTLLIFFAIQGGIYYVAVTPATSLPAIVMGALGMGGLGICGLTVWLVWQIPRRIRVLSSSNGEEMSGSVAG